MYYVEVRCCECDSVLNDLDVILDVGSSVELDDECWHCGSDQHRLVLRYVSEQQKTTQGYATGGAYETDL